MMELIIINLNKLFLATEKELIGHLGTLNET